MMSGPFGARALQCAEASKIALECGDMMERVQESRAEITILKGEVRAMIQCPRLFLETYCHRRIR